MIKVALVGGSGGIGAALLSQLSNRDDIDAIHSTYFRSLDAGSLGSIGSFGSGAAVHWAQVDITDETSVKNWLDGVGSFDWLINCAGFLHDNQSGPEKTIAQFNPQHFQKSMDINCLANLLLAKYSFNSLKNAERGVFAALTAKVGSIEDNRLGGWYSYRAAKAAANMVIKNLSIEWQRTAPQVRVVALHPGTTNTRLSAPFQSRVAPENLFSTQKTADLLIAQIDQLHDYPSGRFIAYDGEELPW